MRQPFRLLRIWLTGIVAALCLTSPVRADVVATVVDVVDTNTVKVEIIVRLRDITVPAVAGACVYERALAKAATTEVSKVIGLFT